MDILCIDIMSIISLIHVITQAQPSALPRLGPVLPGAEVSFLVTSAPVPICPNSSALVPKCLIDTSALVPKCLGFQVFWVRSVLTPL